MRAFRPRLRDRAFSMEVEPGILIPAQLEDYMDRWVFVNCYTSDRAVRLSRLLIRPGDTVIDVGANIGLWVMGAAARAGKSGSVHAFEPVPATFARLRAHLRLNALDWVACHRVALSDRRGTLTLFLAPGGSHSGLASMGKQEGVDVPIQTPAMTLDEYCDEHGITGADFLKIDVEGAELLVLRGAGNLLSSRKAPAILFEVDEELAAHVGCPCTEVKALLAEHGYRFFSYDGQRLTSVPVERPEAHGDLFAFQPRHFTAHGVLRRLRALAT
jgi:FkbM family methyltransferase